MLKLQTSGNHVLFATLVDIIRTLGVLLDSKCHVVSRPCMLWLGISETRLGPPHDLPLYFYTQSSGSIDFTESESFALWSDKATVDYKLITNGTLDRLSKLSSRMSEDMERLLRSNNMVRHRASFSGIETTRTLEIPEVADTTHITLTCAS